LVFKVINLFILENGSKGNTSHVRIIGGFVIVREQVGALVVGASVLCVELKPQVVLELIVTGAFLVDGAEGRVIE